MENGEEKNKNKTKPKNKKEDLGGEIRKNSFFIYKLL
jgi:hypothetical protein